MKERPILFSGPMVRAILEGRKTQTRRVMKWRDVQPGLNLGFSGLRAVDPDSRGWVLTSMGGSCWQERCAPTPCPYGVPGDRLWVRETWNRTNPGETDDRGIPYFQADGQFPWGQKFLADEIWRPSIHMPRWASRLTLEVKAVRVERLQEISGQDCMDEGTVLPVSEGHHPLLCISHSPSPDKVSSKHPKEWELSDYWRHAYAILWDSINAKRGHGWESNPWVWVVEFEKI